MNELEQEIARREEKNGFMHHNHIEMELVEKDHAVFTPWRTTPPA